MGGVSPLFKVFDTANRGLTPPARQALHQVFRERLGLLYDLNGPTVRRLVLFRVVDAYQFADGREEVLRASGSFGDAGTFLVRLADHGSLEARAKHGEAPRTRVVVAPGLGTATIDVRRAPEFTHPHDKRGVE